MSTTKAARAARAATRTKGPVHCRHPECDRTFQNQDGADIHYGRAHRRKQRRRAALREAYASNPTRLEAASAGTGAGFAELNAEINKVVEARVQQRLAVLQNRMLSALQA